MKLFLILSCFIFFNFSLHANNLGSETGFKIPRFVSLKSNDANLRVGSSINYPIILKYTVRNLPMEIIEEYDSWRKIADFEGNNGWIHKSLIQGDRFAIVKSKSNKIYSKPNGKVIGKIGKSNIVEIKKCLIQWCNISHSEHKGWIKKINLWGVYQNETINIPFYQPLVNLLWKFSL